ncbi:MAG TPA: DUF2905 domain-containing protein [archaeon]|nr:DUF2905 domain-containing protein [archaeon]
MDFGSLSGSLGRTLLIFGLVLVVVGLLLTYGPRVPWLGRLPGDLVLRRGNFTLYFPLTTCILLSVIITILARIFRG